MPKTTYQDMEKYYQTKRKQRKKYYAATAYAQNYKKKYTNDEIVMILEHKKTDRELSELLGRSIKSIQHIRVRYKNDPMIKEYMEQKEKEDV